MSNQEQRATALRRRAERLADQAERILEAEICRDRRAEQDRLRAAAAHADQRAKAAGDRSD
jgi:hypothetical protein